MTEKCKFCGGTHVVSFDEHYVFCTHCTAIYTEMMVVEKHCDHIDKDSITAIRSPWFESARQKIAYITEDWKCSVCGKTALSDGW